MRTDTKCCRLAAVAIAQRQVPTRGALKCPPWAIPEKKSPLKKNNPAMENLCDCIILCKSFIKHGQELRILWFSITKVQVSLGTSFKRKPSNIQDRNAGDNGHLTYRDEDLAKATGNRTVVDRCCLLDAFGSFSNRRLMQATNGNLFPLVGAC